MSLKTGIVRAAANVKFKQFLKSEANAVDNQTSLFKKLLKQASNTEFGRDHHFSLIKNHKDYVKAVPVRDYEGLKPYFDKIINGIENVTWPGKPKYLAKTSGTTSGTKYIPITKSSLSNHIDSGRNTLFSYLMCNPQSKIFNGKMLFLSGSPVLEEKNGLLIGRLSGIVNHEIPSWMKNTMLPKFETNALEPWEVKLEAIVDEIIQKDVTVISGIPPWIVNLFEAIIEKSKYSTVIEALPNLEVYIHGGVNYEPYYKKINELVGKELALIETYPASEGFIAFQDNYQQSNLHLINNSGIFFEFIPLQQTAQANPERLTLAEVELNKDYAVVLSSNAGLWAYMLGDLVRFESINPYKLKVSGRVKQFISAFGEHVIASEIDAAMSIAIKEHQLSVTEFLVAPQVLPDNNGLPYHEWFIEFENIPANLEEVSKTLNKALCNFNIYYNDLIKNNILSNLKITVVRKGGFNEYMRSINKIGEQFKVTRLCNDRAIADQLISKRLII